MTAEPTTIVRKDGTIAQSHGPARGSWPPFEPGNTAHLQTGWRSRRVIDALVPEIEDELVEQSPHAARFPTTVRLGAVMVALAELSAAAALRQMEADPNKVPSRAVESATSAANAALRYLQELGIGNTSFGRLQLVAGHAQIAEHSLADVVKAGRAARIAAGQLLEGETDA